MKTSEMQVTLVDHMGSDLSVVNAARVSFAKESELEELEVLSILRPDDVTEDVARWKFSGKVLDTHELGVDVYTRFSQKDINLINYLATHNHWSPFAHAFLSFRIKAPIFVARQLVKHQVGLSWNEVSRRYVDDEPEFWFPKEWRGRPVNAKQGSSGVVELSSDYSHPGEIAVQALDTYTQMIAQGVAPEQARMVLPQNTMTEWVWSGSLMAFARVCKQRLDPHAQQETREVAEAIAALVPNTFEHSWKALV